MSITETQTFLLWSLLCEQVNNTLYLLCMAFVLFYFSSIWRVTWATYWQMIFEASITPWQKMFPFLLLQHLHSQGITPTPARTHISACAFLWHSSCLYGYGVTQNWHALIECWSSMLLRPVMFYFYIGWVVLWEDPSLTLPANTAMLCTHSEQLS